jgi:iron-sulfur cluster assembly protein
LERSIDSHFFFVRHKGPILSTLSIIEDINAAVPFLIFAIDSDTFHAWLGTYIELVAPQRRNHEGERMITLTPAAIAKVKEILSERQEEAGLRIAVIGGGCSGFQYQMTLDKEPQAEDKILDMEGLKVFIDSRSIPYLNGAQVDFVDGSNGSGFKFDNPNAQASCGCGECFEA